VLQQQHSSFIIKDGHSCSHRETPLSNPSDPIPHPLWKMAPDSAEELLEHEAGSITRQLGGNSQTGINATELPITLSVYQDMWEYVFLAAVVAFIVLCTIISLILKELYRRW